MYVLQANPGIAPRWAHFQDIKKRFGEQYGPSIQTAPAFSMNAEFAPVLQRQMNAFNSDPPGDSLQVLTHIRLLCRQQTNGFRSRRRLLRRSQAVPVSDATLRGIRFVVPDLTPITQIPVLRQ